MASTNDDAPRMYAGDEAPEGYGYVALQDINLGGVRAFNRGDLVPDEHVERHQLSSSGADAVVAKHGTKPAGKVAQDLVDVQNQSTAPPATAAGTPPPPAGTGTTG